MSWLDKLKVKTGIGSKIVKPEIIWVECKGCGEQLYIAEVEKNFKVCPNCDYHFRIEARERISHLINPGTFVEHDPDLYSTDPLKFKDKKKYKDRIRTTHKKGLPLDALVSGSGVLGDHPVEISIFEFKFMGGSMGSVVGEKITRSIERAIANKTAMIIVSCSGGARMQEGIFSLMQMAKTSSALRRLADCKLPYISILTDPTTGGVSASFAMLGDVILAEPGALIGFAGPRVIEQTIQQKLPEGFQKAEFLLEHGLIDSVVHRRDLKKTLNNLLSFFGNKPIHKVTASA
ncbi:MAG: acetyl-coenzyme A carboxylase carboxyl transferase subunit beta [Nitrospinaceae bacterium]|nr:MAG: acetyl-coenzyme A carboxylase carboxyl transferase subunit beta [Nitrospinaceae bacterium]